jgi:hypothetical protein
MTTYRPAITVKHIAENLIAAQSSSGTGSGGPT